MNFDLVKMYTALGLGGFGVIVMSGIAIYLIKHVIATQTNLVRALEENAKALISIADSLKTLNDTIRADNREARIKRNQIDNRLVRIDTKLINKKGR